MVDPFVVHVRRMGLNNASRPNIQGNATSGPIDFSGLTNNPNPVSVTESIPSLSYPPLLVHLTARYQSDHEPVIESMQA